MAQVCADNGSRDGSTDDAKFNGIPDLKATLWWYAIKASAFNFDAKIIDVGWLHRRFKLVTEPGQLIEADSATGRCYFKIPVGISVKTLMVINDQSNWSISTVDYYFSLK